MPTYRVSWDIDIEADTPEEAAKQAREIQLDLESIATQFVVSDADKTYVVDTYAEKGE